MVYWKRQCITYGMLQPQDVGFGSTSNSTCAPKVKKDQSQRLVHQQ